MKRISKAVCGLVLAVCASAAQAAVIVPTEWIADGPTTFLVGETRVFTLRTLLPANVSIDTFGFEVVPPIGGVADITGRSVSAPPWTAIPFPDLPLGIGGLSFESPTGTVSLFSVSILGVSPGTGSISVTQRFGDNRQVLNGRLNGSPVVLMPDLNSLSGNFTVTAIPEPSVLGFAVPLFALIGKRRRA